MNVSERTVEVRVSKTLELLRKQLKDFFYPFYFQSVFPKKVTNDVEKKFSGRLNTIKKEIMTDKDQIQSIITAYLSGKATNEERRELERLGESIF